MTTVIEIPAKPKKLTADRFQPAEAARNIWSAKVSLADTLEDVLQPGYWVGVSHKINMCDRIECVWEDGSRFVELLVESTIPAHEHRGGQVRMAVLRDVRTNIGPGDAEADENGGLRIEHRGLHSQWTVLRGEQVLRDQFPNKKAAQQWLRSHVQTRQSEVAR